MVQELEQVTGYSSFPLLVTDKPFWAGFEPQSVGLKKSVMLNPPLHFYVLP
jgi:hypothetical protein